jgi:parvulin-like peptidyl-prolyl isomerase
MTLFAALLRQPMLHFLAGGALLFLAYEVLGGGAEDGAASRAQRAERRILITRGQVESLASGFTVRWRRPPSDEELAELVAEHVREEALVREALALGLDQGDAVIRRQLRLKVEFLAQDAASSGEPTDEELRALLTREPDRFSMPAQITFRHVFLDSARRGEGAARTEAGRLLAALQGPDGEAGAEEAGDRFLPGYAFRQVAAPEIARSFGGDIAAALEAMPVGRWTGPVPSAYGLHLLRVEARTDARLPPLDEVRPALRAEWAARRRREVLDASVAALVSRYAVTVEGAAGGPAAAGR